MVNKKTLHEKEFRKLLTTGKDQSFPDPLVYNKQHTWIIRWMKAMNNRPAAKALRCELEMHEDSGPPEMSS